MPRKKTTEESKEKQPIMEIESTETGQEQATKKYDIQDESTGADFSQEESHTEPEGLVVLNNESDSVDNALSPQLDSETYSDGTLETNDGNTTDALSPEPEPKQVRRRKSTRSTSTAEEIKTVPISDAFPNPAIPAKEASVLYLERTAPSQVQNGSDIWHDLQHSRKTNRSLSGTIGAIEVNQAKTPLVIVYYRQDQRVVIPYSEMGISADDPMYSRIFSAGNETEQRAKILNGMLGAEIDFVVRGLDSKARTVVASRDTAMRKKRAHFYFTPDLDGLPFVRPGRRAEARVVAVTRYNVRVEIFGVETVINVDNLSWDWVSDVSEIYSVGDIIIVRITNVSGDTPDTLKVEADVKSLQQNRSREKLFSCGIGARYHGTISDIRRGVVHIQLDNGVLGIAHSCYDRRYPGIRDDVAFIVTSIDPDRNRVNGIISKILRRNI